MEKVSCKCLGCGGKLGDFINCWVQIGKAYYSPVVPHDVLKTNQSGLSRTGSSGTLVASCELQDLACVKCNSVVAIQCISTPINHVLTEGQILLHLAKVKLVKRGGIVIQPTVQRQLKLRDNSQPATTSDDLEGDARPASNAFSASSDSMPGVYHSVEERMREEIQIQRRDINRLDNAGHQIVSAFDTTVVGIRREVKQLKDSLQMATGDSDHNSKRATTLEEQLAELRSRLNSMSEESTKDSPLFRSLEEQVADAMKSLESLMESMSAIANTTASVKSDLAKTRKEMSALRFELLSAKKAATDSISNAKQYATEVLGMRNELEEVRKELEQERSSAATAARSASKNAIFPSREIEILTSNIAKISSRASKVETLDMEMELMKGRMQRLEERKVETMTTTPILSTIKLHPPNQSIPSTQKQPTRSQTTQSPITVPSKRVATSQDRVSQNGQDLGQQYDEIPSSPAQATSMSDPKRRCGRPSSSGNSTPSSLVSRSMTRRSLRKSQVPKMPFRQD
ncbi:hypothetical protein MKZ38_004327 [Zalerion maritima]|uniref:Uncharacterized protein n=1 Tax=Zalerion maritima TaxID=339359 RepID=A0AAD5RLL9_9PEZI|nr:hypothetical protein MKZ38_004327 [Zalerion maritima]